MAAVALLRRLITPTIFIRLLMSRKNRKSFLSLREIQEKYQRLDAVINNAAIFHQGLALLSSKETLQTVFETNVFGTFMVCRESAKLMQKKKYGRIINLGSIALTMKIEGSSFYASSKAAILEMTKILAKELALLTSLVIWLRPV